MAKKTKVVFKKFPEGDVIAIFPELLGDSDYVNTCLSYQTIGQHGSCSVDLLDELDSASQEEYQNLKTELESEGYNLIVYSYVDTDRSKGRRLQSLLKMVKK